MKPIATEEERVMMLKVWWQKNRTWLLSTVIVAALGYAGFKYYTHDQQKTAEAASLLFTEFFGAYEGGDATLATSLAEQMRTQYAHTPYANSVELILAQQAVDQENLPAADEHLTWIVNQGTGFAKDIAKARLAQVKLAQGQPEEALKLVETSFMADYQPLYDEIKGDVLVELKRYSDARVAYDNALQGYTELGFQTHLLQFKLDALPQA